MENTLKKQPAQQQRDLIRFAQDVLALFAGKRTRNLSVYADGAAWEEASAQLENTYMADEAAVIAKHAKAIAGLLPENITAVDLGAGTEHAVLNKILPLLQALKSPKEFFAVDADGIFAESAANLVAQKTNIPSKALANDFMQDDLYFNQPAVFFLFGGMFCGADKNTRQSWMQQLALVFSNLMRHAIKKNDYLVISQDVNVNEKDILKAYDQPAMADYVLSILDKIKINLITSDFDPAAFKYVPKWDEESRLLTLNARTKYDCVPKFQDRRFILSDGKDIPLMSDYKFTVDDFVTAAKFTGYQLLHSFGKDSDNFIVHVFKRS